MTRSRLPDGRRPTARLGLGLAAIGRPAYITLGRDADLPADRSPGALQARAHALLDAATDLGIDYVDTARSYGLAEQFLATWLQRSASRPFVASKWGYRYTGGWRTDADRHEVKEHSLAAFRDQWAESLALLGPWLRLYQVHSLTSDSPLWADRELLRALVAVRAGGMEVGLSTSGPDQSDAVHRALELTVDGVGLFTSVQSTWNLLERSAGPALAAAHEAGLRVVVKEALANGRLTDPASLAAAALRPAAASQGVGVDALALAAVLAQPWCHVVLSGAVTLAQLEANARARDVVDGGSVVSLVEPEPPGGYWAHRSSLAWA